MAICGWNMAESPRLFIRVTPHVEQMIELAAQIKGVTPSQFVADAATKEAERVIERQRSLEEWSNMRGRFDLAIGPAKKVRWHDLNEEQKAAMVTGLQAACRPRYGSEDGNRKD